MTSFSKMVMVFSHKNSFAVNVKQMRLIRIIEASFRYFVLSYWIWGCVQVSKLEIEFCIETDSLCRDACRIQFHFIYLDEKKIQIQN